ncbi:MAG: hypothetical protein M3228_00935 [Actinomycetota bacterium]|nr:hypothetical protein [Actinomycetota bacterium]
MGTLVRLEDGWGVDTPVGDTLLHRYVLNLAAYQEAVATAMGGRTLRRDDLVAADLGHPSGLYNSAVLLRPPERVEDILADIEAFYDGHGCGDVELWSPWPTPDLTARGWELEGHPPLLVRPAGRAPAGVDPPELRIEAVTTATGVRDWERVAVEGFPFPEVLPWLPGAIANEKILSDDRTRLWVGYVEDRPVVIGSLFVEAGIGHLSLGVTLPEARGRGYWAAMARRRLAVLPGLPAAGVFSDMSRPGAEARGFLPIVRFTLWRRRRG